MHAKPIEGVPSWGSEISDGDAIFLFNCHPYKKSCCRERYYSLKDPPGGCFYVNLVTLLVTPAYKLSPIFYTHHKVTSL